MCMGVGAGTVTAKVVEPQSLEGLSADQLREMAARLMTQLRHQGALVKKLTHENALLKCMKFATQSERFNAEQKSLLEDDIEADLAAIATKIEALQKEPAAANLQEKKQPKRLPLPTTSVSRALANTPGRSWVCGEAA